MSNDSREQHERKPRRTFLEDAPASAPEVRPDDVIPPFIPEREERVAREVLMERRARLEREGVKRGDPGWEREDGLSPEELDHELDEGVDGSFPASDPPSIVSPKRPDDLEHSDLEDRNKGKRNQEGRDE